MRRLTRDEIETASRALVSARETALGIEISTPVIYPNGDCVTVLVTIDGGEYVVHDAGLGLMYLTAEGVQITRHLSSRFAALAARYECEFIDGRMMRRCSADDVAVAAVLVANASRTVGDHALEVRRQTENEFRAAVSDRVREIAGTRLRENETFKGGSGRSYRITNVILDAQEMHAAAFVFALPSRSLVPAQFAEMFDLKAAHADTANDTIYNEAGDFRRKEDGWLLEKVSELIPFGEIAERLPRQIGVKRATTEQQVHVSR